MAASKKTSKTSKTRTRSKTPSKTPSSAEKPCAPLANGRPRVRNPATGRCGLAKKSSPKKSPKMSPKKSPNRRTAAAYFVTAAAKNGNNGTCINPKTKVPGVPGYTWMKMIRDMSKTVTKTSRYWGPIAAAVVLVIAAKYAMNLKPNALAYATGVVARTAASPFKAVGDAVEYLHGKTAWFKAKKLAIAASTASDLCDYYGQQVIESVKSRAKELGMVFHLMCAGRYGSSDAVNQGYMEALKMITDSKEDPIIRLGMQKVLEYQTELFPVNGTDAATLRAFEGMWMAARQNLDEFM